MLNASKALIAALASLLPAAGALAAPTTLFECVVTNGLADKILLQEFSPTAGALLVVQSEGARDIVFNVQHGAKPVQINGGDWTERHAFTSFDSAEIFVFPGVSNSGNSDYPLLAYVTLGERVGIGANAKLACRAE